MSSKSLSKSTAVKIDPANASVELGLAPPAVPNIQFETEPKSPFADGYSIAKEEALLADFIQSDPMDESDPRFDRFVELDERRDRLEKMQQKFATRKGAEPVVTPEEVRGIGELGSLVDEGVDQMTLHTKEAYRMFMGRSREPGKDTAPIIGGKRTAAALRALWLLTSNDNPFADWGLLRHEHSMREVHKRLQREIEATNKTLVDQQRRGLSYTTLRSASPVVLNLGFRSPYGYAVSSLIADFDYFVRLQKTLEHKSLRTDDQVRQTITELTRFVRRCWNETARFDRWLNRDEMRSLSRSDFLPTAPEDAAKRIEFAAGVFGTVPSEVYSCALQPSHSRRRLQISPAERKLLQTVGEQMARMEQEAKEAAATLDGNDGKPDAGLV